MPTSPSRWHTAQTRLNTALPADGSPFDAERGLVGVDHLLARSRLVGEDGLGPLPQSPGRDGSSSRLRWAGSISAGAIRRSSSDESSDAVQAVPAQQDVEDRRRGLPASRSSSPEQELGHLGSAEPAQRGDGRLLDGDRHAGREQTDQQVAVVWRPAAAAKPSRFDGGDACRPRRLTRRGPAGAPRRCSLPSSGSCASSIGCFDRARGVEQALRSAANCQEA